MYSERASIYEIEYLESRDASFLKGLITNGNQSSVLEIPCGAGRLSVQLAECVSRYVVADLEEDMVQVAKRRLCEEKNYRTLLHMLRICVI